MSDDLKNNNNTEKDQNSLGDGHAFSGWGGSLNERQERIDREQVKPYFPNPEVVTGQPESGQNRQQQTDPHAAFQQGRQNLRSKIPGQQQPSQRRVNFPRGQGFPPGQRPPQGQQGGGGQKPPKKKFNFKEFVTKKWWLVILLILGICLSGLGLYLLLTGNGEEEQLPYNNVEAVIEAPTTSALGAPSEWTVRITNNENVDLRKVELKLNFDSKFTFNRKIIGDPVETIGHVYQFETIAAGGEEIIKFEGILKGNIDEETVMSGNMKYTPEPLLNETGGERSLSLLEATTKISTPDIDVTMVPSSETVENGSDFKMTVIFKNVSGREINDLRLKMDYPGNNNFEYTSSKLVLQSKEVQDEPDSGNNIWYVDNVSEDRNVEHKLEVEGLLSGVNGITQTFTFEISIKNQDGTWQTFTQTTKEVLVVSQPVTISTTIEGGVSIFSDNIKVFTPDDDITVSISYKNVSNANLTKLEVSSSIDDPLGLLDWSTLKYIGGDEGNVLNREISWRSSGAAQLINVKPGGSGKIKYSIKVKDSDSYIRSTYTQDKYTLQPSAKIKLDDGRIFETTDSDIYRARGSLEFNQDVNLIEAESTDEQRVYQINWTIKTRQNKVDNVKIVTGTNLPPNSWSQTSITPSVFNDKITYDVNTGVIEFNLGSLGSYVGITEPAVTVSFKLTVDRPEEGTFDNMEILKVTNITGVDNLTGENYQTTEKEVEIDE